MMLEDPENRGCPFEYLLARIRSRRSRPGTARDGSPQKAEAPPAMTASSAAEPIPTGSEAGRVWLWRLMEPKQRAVHAPLFFYHELKPLGLALRRREARRWDESKRIMATSLLSRPLRQMIIDESSSTGDALDGIIRLLGKNSKGFDCLRGTYRAGGIKAFEEALLGSTLAYAAEAARHPALRAFFDRQSDVFNLLTLSRQLRWRSAAAPPLLPGGRIGKATMAAWLAGEDPDGRDAFTTTLDDPPHPDQPAASEG